MLAKHKIAEQKREIAKMQQRTLKKMNAMIKSEVVRLQTGYFPCRARDAALVDVSPCFYLPNVNTPHLFSKTEDRISTKIAAVERRIHNEKLEKQRLLHEQNEGLLRAQEEKRRMEREV